MTWRLSLENIAGIRQGDARVEPGVNAVRASNWQGKSSFLAGIKTALGVETPLTEGQESGRVVLTTDDDEYTVELTRTNGTVSRTGTPYLTDEYDRVCADLFACLDEDNEIRRAVRAGEDLEPLLTRPLDFENIDERIGDLQAERGQVEAELERAEEAAGRLPQLEARVASLESELASLREERRDLDDTSATADGSAQAELSDLRAERDQVTKKVDRLEATADRARDRLAEVEAELESLTVESTDEVESELETVHDELRTVERDRELLQSVFEANRRILDEGRVELLTDVSHDLLSDSLTCWVCGQDASRDDVEAQLDALDERISELRDEASTYRDRVEDLERKRDEAREARRRRQDLEDRAAELRSRLAETEETLEETRRRREELDERIEGLAAEVEETEDRVTDLESEIKYTEAELSDVEEELTETERRAAQRDLLSEEYDDLTAEIAELRTRKEDVKRRTREAFSTALSEVVDRFETGFETARLTSTFDLVVARDRREASLDALSEGERELLGLVVALAGHEAFGVGDRVPVLLLDGVGGLASDNLALLVEYLRPRADYLVLTAYPEYEPFDGHELSPAEWDVVSHAVDTSAPS